MTEKDLAKVWSDIQSNKQTSLGEEEQALNRLAQAVKKEGEECPEPPAGMTSAIMAKIQEPKMPYWRVLQVVGSMAILAIIYINSGSNTIETVTPHSDGRTIRYNDRRVVEATNGILLYAEGSLGAVGMIVFIIASIIALTKRRFRLAGILFAIAILIFLTRTLMQSFFNDVNVLP